MIETGMRVDADRGTGDGLRTGDRTARAGARPYARDRERIAAIPTRASSPTAPRRSPPGGCRCATGLRFEAEVCLPTGADAEMAAGLERFVSHDRPDAPDAQRQGMKTHEVMTSRRRSSTTTCSRRTAFSRKRWRARGGLGDGATREARPPRGGEPIAGHPGERQPAALTRTTAMVIGSTRSSSIRRGTSSCGSPSATSLHALPWRDPRPEPTSHAAALFFVLSQVEAGHGCPISMTYSACRAPPAARAGARVGAAPHFHEVRRAHDPSPERRVASPAWR